MSIPVKIAVTSVKCVVDTTAWKRVEDAELGFLLTASHRLTAHGRGRAIAMEAPFGLAFNYPGQLSWGVPWTASFRTIAAI